MYVPPTVKPLCPPEEKPRFEDVAYATVKLDDGQDYTLKLDIYQSAGQDKPGPCIIYILAAALCGESISRLRRRRFTAVTWSV